MKLKLSAIVALALASSVSLGAAEKMTTSTINVYSATPLPSIGLPANIVPANIQIATPKNINNQAGVSLADYMNTNMQSISTTEMGGNPWQPEITFRGFSASPLLGMPQGISTYIDGVRVNEPFGDVTLWDKIPNFAIGGMQLIPGSNPLFGLNTLGGAISIQTKSGREAKGAAAEFEAGSWNRQRYLAEYGGVSKDGSIDYYIGHQTTKEEGWRQFSPSRLNQTFGKVGWQSEKSKIDLSYIGTDNKLTGNGFTPDFLLTGDRDQIHTRPDITNNFYNHLVLNGSHWLGNDIMISGNAYYRNSNRNTKNGDIWERDMDNGDVYQGVTCVGELDGGVRSGDCELGGSVMNRTSTKQKNLGFTLQASFNQDLMGKKNQLITGLGFDQSRIGYRQSEQANLSTESDAIADDQITGSTGSAMVFDATRDTVLTGNGALAEFQTTGLKSKQKTMSLFATDTLSLNDKWHLNAGARYNHTRVNNDDLLRPDPNTNSRSLTADATYARVNPTVGLTFTPSDKISAFGSYSESSRAPTAIELGCSNPANPCLLPSAMADDPPLKQVVARTYDFGLKGSLTDSIKFNASIYQTINDNDIQFVRSTTLRNGGYFSNVGDTQRRGLDFGLNGQQDKFKWAASYSYIRATFEDDLSLASPANSSAAYGFDNTDRYKINVQKGDYMPSIPKHQLKLRAQYAVTQDWSIGANVIGYTDQYVWGNENNEHSANASALAATNAEPTGDDSRAACGATGSTSGNRWRGPACGSGKVAGYMVVNLDTQYNIGSGWKAFAKAVNIFDQDYNIAGRLVETNFDSTASYTGNERNVLGLLPGAPRAGWIGVRYEFGGAPEAK